MKEHFFAGSNFRATRKKTAYLQDQSTLRVPKDMQVLSSNLSYHAKLSKHPFPKLTFIDSIVLQE